MATQDAQVSFSELLQSYRAAAGLSQDELAERAGLSRRGISDLERGERRLPHPATVRRLASGLGLDLTERAVLLAAVRQQEPPSRARVPLGFKQLPESLSSLVGRERELAEVLRL